MSQLSQYAKAVWVFAIQHTLEREGINTEEFFSANNFNINNLDSVQDNVSRAIVNHLWTEAIKVSRNDAFCLKTIDFINEPFINALVSVTRASRSIRDALVVLQRFHTLISPELRVQVKMSSHLSIEASNVPLHCEWRPEDCDITLAIIAKHALAIGTNEIKPIALTLTRGKPAQAEDYEALFNCDIYYNSDKNKILYPKEVLDLNIPSFNPHMYNHFHSYLEQSLDKQISKEKTEALSIKVSDFLKSCFGKQFPSLSECASHFHMSTSALKRHLHIEDSCFQQISDKVREEEACKLIKNKHLSLKEIAYHLGFANSSVFTKAFKRWKGVGPSEYAKQIELISQARRPSKPQRVFEID